MSTTVRQRTSGSRSAADESSERRDEVPTGTTRREAVTISASVIEKIAATAARTVPGIHPAVDRRGFTNGLVRAAKGRGGTDGIRARIRGNREISLGMRMAVDYGEHIPSVAQEVRFAVAKAIREMTGLDTREVKVKITEVLSAEGGATEPSSSTD